MDDKRFKQALAEALRMKGFSIREVPESDSPTPDFEAELDSENFLIELKTRFDGGLDYEDEVRCDGLARNNPTSGIVRNSVKQISTYRQSPDAIGLLWVLAPRLERTLVYEQFRMTVYGIEIAAGSGRLMECYYSTFNDFYRFREELDGIALGNFGRLLLNEFSPRYDRLRGSKFRELFGSAVYDPPELEKEGNILAVQGKVDRRSQSAVKAHLKDTYDLEIATLTNLVRFSAQNDGNGCPDAVPHDVTMPCAP